VLLLLSGVAGICGMRRRHPPCQDYEARARLRGQLISLRFSSFCSFHGVDLLQYGTRIPPPTTSKLHQQLTTPNNQARKGLALGVSSVALRFWGAPSKRDRGFIRFGRSYLASSLLTVKNASIVRSSAQRRSVLFSLPFLFSSSSSSI